MCVCVRARARAYMCVCVCVSVERWGEGRAMGRERRGRRVGYVDESTREQ